MFGQIRSFSSHGSDTEVSSVHDSRPIAARCAHDEWQLSSKDHRESRRCRCPRHQARVDCDAQLDRRLCVAEP
ncbi:Rieske 2Fe-2S domain-containing protein [Granulicella aggregans]|uniref:Rieske 2Fe-2S domain-containing protein n=1 Tax=Granulicella aggregans TaxID=474949 RepID=UPI003D7C20C7